MIAYVLYQPNSETETQATAISKQLEELQVPVQLVDGDSVEGIRLNELYDLPARPAIVLVRDDGTMVERWQHQLPLATDISYLAHN